MDEWLTSLFSNSGGGKGDNTFQTVTSGFGTSEGTPVSGESTDATSWMNASNTLTPNSSGDYSQQSTQTSTLWDSIKNMLSNTTWSTGGSVGGIGTDSSPAIMNNLIMQALAAAKALSGM